VSQGNTVKTLVLLDAMDAYQAISRVMPARLNVLLV
jgi:hypothetical protein